MRSYKRDLRGRFASGAAAGKKKAKAGVKKGKAVRKNFLAGVDRRNVKANAKRKRKGKATISNKENRTRRRQQFRYGTVAALSGVANRKRKANKNRKAGTRKAAATRAAKKR